MLLYRHNISQCEQEAAMQADKAIELQIGEAYARVNHAFWLGGLDPSRHVYAYRISGRYKPFPEIPLEENKFGIRVIMYQTLLMYYHRTGFDLAYETVIDYFSQEFESDGSLRLYNNGNHPEIEAFVAWFLMTGTQEVQSYFDATERIYTIYFFAHRDEGFINQSLTELSPQMLRALARAEADPDYVLDLTSLQQQGY